MRFFLSFLFLALLGFVGRTPAAPPTAALLGDAVYEWSLDTVLRAASYDTMTNNDSSTIVTKFVFDDGWQYVLVVNGWTGSGNDSTRPYIALDMFVKSTDASASYRLSLNGASDSLTSNSGNVTHLPIGITAFGRAATIKFINPNNSGNQLIPGKITLWRVRPVAIKRSFF
jgi:hypothetical protein